MHHTIYARPKADPRAEPTAFSVSAHVGDLDAARQHFATVCPQLDVIEETAGRADVSVPADDHASPQEPEPT